VPSAKLPPPDPLLAVVEALHALRRSEDVVEGAALVLRTAMAAIPCAAGFVHVCDVGTRDFVVVAASGPEQAEVVGTRATDADPWLGRAMQAMQAVMTDASDAALLTGTRFGIVRPLHAVLCSPVQFDGRALGAIELVDPTRTDTFTLADRNAMTYVGERFAEFLAERSIAF
jgi:GAF domain-containing protein